ncbi:MAG TPA: AMP-binding protein [Candidatus Dormibacteraeota bacterium]|nr:AMP-binding protein [Candidatus Dormibacteraeota bacterium]
MDGPIWHSPLPPTDLTPAFVDDEVLRMAGRFTSRPAVVDALTGREITFGRLAADARRLAAGLARHGVGPRGRVSIVAVNGPSYVVALYGALAAGATVASANAALTAAELARQFAKTRPRIVFADAVSRPAVQEALAAAGPGAELCTLDGGGDERSLADLLAEPAARPAGRDPGDLALLFPSSGTTGLPKVVAHTHAGTTAYLRAIGTAPTLRFTQADVIALVVPFTHLYGTAVLSHSLRCGATVVTLGAPAFDLEAFLRMLQDHAVTAAPVTPPVVLALARHPLVDRFDLSSLRLLISGAAPCPVAPQDEVEARLGCLVTDLLGSTEAWCATPPADPPVRGSVGIVGANMEAVVVDVETGARLGPDRPGELWLRGPQVMHSYLDDERATAAALDADGWHHTGDVCTIDADGNIFVVDRLRELIKVGGHSVAPAEVERELVAHPAVADAAVVGRPDPELGEVPVAYVSLHRPSSRAALVGWLEGRLAPWKHVRDVVVVERIPRSPIGKILRRELIERERDARAVP